jgi:hypothetical protein
MFEFDMYTVGNLSGTGDHFDGFWSKVKGAVKGIVKAPVNAIKATGRAIDVTSSKSAVRQAGRFIDKNKKPIIAGAIAVGAVAAAAYTGGASLAALKVSKGLMAGGAQPQGALPAVPAGAQGYPEAMPGPTGETPADAATGAALTQAASGGSAMPALGGAAVGFMVGGPIGGVVGLAAGALAGRKS